MCDKKVAPASHGYDEPDPEVDGNLGINKHSDAGCLTVLRQYSDEPASLQVYHFGDEQWYRVVPVEGALTINIGDMMQVWSNGKYRAPLHRVLANKTREAAPFSTILFCCHGVARGNCGPPIYYPLSWAEFRRRRFEGDFGDSAADVQISDWLIGRRQVRWRPPSSRTPDLKQRNFIHKSVHPHKHPLRWQPFLLIAIVVANSSCLHILRNLDNHSIKVHAALF